MARYDGRNPYGARGGYVRDSRMSGRMDSYPDYYDMDYEMDERERDYAMDSRRGGRYDRYPFEMSGRVGDRHYSRMLSRQEISKWTKKLMSEIDDKEKQFLKMENIIRRAEDMGIKFEEFNEDEFYVTVVMMFSDFGKAMGTMNPDMYIKLAKYWLCDEDAEVQYGEKLAAYYDAIVLGR